MPVGTIGNDVDDLAATGEAVFLDLCPREVERAAHHRATDQGAPHGRDPR